MAIREQTKRPLTVPNAKNEDGCHRFGAHMSVAGGLENACTAGVMAGCECLQIFVKNQRQWRTPALREDQVSRFRMAARASGLHPIVAHGSYLLNLASGSDFIRDKSIAATIDELQRCEALGLEALIFHPGAHGEDTPEMGIRRAVASLNSVLRSTVGLRTMILLETTAGQGSAIGWRFEQIATLRATLTAPDRVGVCLDTCHLFAAGYDFRSAAGYAAMMEEMDRVIGLTHVRCIHTNDSKRELGSRVDRHERIGKGRIGKSGFVHFVNDPRWAGMPMILETPKGKDGRGTDLDKVNLRRLRALIAMANVE